MAPGDVDETLPLTPSAAAETLLSQRYRVGALIGRGGSGQVHRAFDTLHREWVAVKFVRALDDRDRERLRRELAALRWLRLPGVVGLRDDGVTGTGQAFLVMDLLDGGSFADLVAGGWAGGASASRSIVDTLIAVHRAGVVHRDLKPSNVLLDGGRRPVIVDFGVALGAAVTSDPRGRVEGSPRYMPPEQLRGEPAHPAMDVYALGAMFHELVSGQRFLGVVCREELSAPPTVVDTIVRMLDPNPSGRPSAEDVLVAFGGASDEDRLPDLRGVGRRALRRVFDEPRRTFRHVAADAATMLWTRGDGDPDRMRTELGVWVRRGIARIGEDGRIHVEPDALHRIETVAAGEGDVWLAGVIGRAEKLARSGHPSRALGILERIGPTVHTAAVELHRRWVITYVDATLWLEQLGPIDLALYQVDRALARGIDVSEAGRVLRSARAVLTGQPELAIELATVPISGDEVLEVWRASLLVRGLNSGSIDRHEQTLTDLRHWAVRSAERQSAWWTWMGHLAYRRGSFEAASRAHLQAAELRRLHPHARQVSRVNAALAALEALDFEAAASVARLALESSRRSRNAVCEVRSSYVVRVAAYRSGQPLRVDPSWARSAAEVSLVVAASFSLIDAAIAWRIGDSSALFHARSAAKQFVDLGHDDGVALARALECAVGGTGTDPTFWQPTVSNLSPRIAVQVGALLRVVGVAVDTSAAWKRLEGTPQDRRLDVLSLSEARSFETTPLGSAHGQL